MNSLLNNTKKYRTTKNECINCVFGKSCKAKFRRSHKARAINVNFFHQLQAKIRDKEKTEVFKKKLRERMWKIEGIFAEAKNFHGLRRARYRGRNNMQIQAYMIGSVQNLKRLIDAVSLVLCRLRKFWWNLNINWNFAPFSKNILKMSPAQK